MNYSKTLRWVEPYDGWKNFDTGLCNRILHWEIAYEINKNNNFEYQILLQKKYWPELGLIYLPNTSFIDSNEGETVLLEKTRFITHYDEQNLNSFLTSPIHPILLTETFNENKFKLDGNNHWYSNFGFKTLLDIDGYKTEKRPLQYIRLKHGFIEDLLRNTTKDVIGIHIRRGCGIRYNEKDIRTLPKDIQEQFKAYRILNKNSEIIHPKYNFINDDVYFNIIDRMLEFNPYQKFFISSDLPYSLISYYKKRYKDNLIFKNDIISVIENYLLNSDISLKKLEYGNVISNIIDLFALSFCKLLVKSDNSTFSEFAEVYRGQPSVNATDDWYDVIMHKFLDIKWLQPDEYNFEENLDLDHIKKTYITEEKIEQNYVHEDNSMDTKKLTYFKTIL